MVFMPYRAETYAVRAYGKNGEGLSIGALPCLDTPLEVYVAATYLSKTLGNVLAKPEEAQTKRIAYFRTHLNGVLKAIYVTMYGRESGIRDYQTRRPEDNSGPVQILGYVPLHTRPRIIRMDAGYQLIVGEGDPAATATPGRREDQWGYPIVCVATCRRVTLNRTNGAWWGYTYENHITGESLQLRGHRAKMVRAGLTKVGFEMLNTRGRDITRW